MFRGMNFKFSVFSHTPAFAMLCLVAVLTTALPLVARADEAPKRGISGRSFMFKMTSHVLGEEFISEETMQYFPTLPPKYMRDRAKFHDASKLIQSEPFLKEFGLPLDVPVPEVMGPQFGTFVNEEDLDRGMIDRINKADDAIAAKIDSEHKPTPEQKRLADMKEHVDDLTERGLAERLFPPDDGVYERGSKMRLASDYILNSPAEAKKWTLEEREFMSGIARKLETSPTFLAKLKKAKSPYKVELRMQQFLEVSHFTKDVRRIVQISKSGPNSCPEVFANLNRRRTDVKNR